MSSSRITRASGALTNTNLAGGAIFGNGVTDWLDSVPDGINYVAASVYMDQAGTLALQVTDDKDSGNTTETVTTATVTASTALTVGPIFLTKRFWRWVLTNTAGSTTTTLVLFQTISTIAASPGRQQGDYWDRNPDVRLLVYDADNVAPHVQTIRATRTVPSGKRAFIEAGFNRLCRATAASAIGTSARSFCRIVRSSVSYPYCGVDLDANTNAIGFAKSITAGGAGLILAGDQLDITTRDDNTNGTVNYSAMAKMTEFDV